MLVIPKWNYPLDPDCSEVKDYIENTMNDPIMKECGCSDEFYENFSKNIEKNVNNVKNMVLVTRRLYIECNILRI